MTRTVHVRIALALTAGAGIVVDQISKAVVVARIGGHPPVHIVGSVLMLDESRNPGAAFSFAPAATVVFALLAATISALLVRAANGCTRRCGRSRSD